MDDEDLAELRESRQLVDENEEMDFGGTEAEMRRRAGPSAEEEYVPTTCFELSNVLTFWKLHGKRTSRIACTFRF